MTVGMSLCLARRRPPTRRAIPTAEIVGRVNDFGGWCQLPDGMGAWDKGNRGEGNSGEGNSGESNGPGPASVRYAVASPNQRVSSVSRTGNGIAPGTIRASHTEPRSG